MAKKEHKSLQLDDLDLKEDHPSDLEFEEMLFEDSSKKPRNSGTAAIISGFGLMATVAIYILQTIGLIPGNIFSDGFIMIPLIGIILVLLFGLLPRRHKSKRRDRKESRKSKPSQASTKKSLNYSDFPQKSKWNFPPKSRKKFLAGVCGGLAKRINMEPTMFRVLFMVILIATGFSVPLIAYILFAIFMPSPEDEEEI